MTVSYTFTQPTTSNSKFGAFVKPNGILAHVTIQVSMQHFFTETISCEESTVTSILMGNRHIRMELSQLGYDCDNKERKVLGQNYRASLRNMHSFLSNLYRDWFRIGGDVNYQYILLPRVSVFCRHVFTK